MATQIQLRRDTAANWTNLDPILTQGEPGVELDTSKIKVGDGTSVWSALPYSGAGTLDLHDVTSVGNVTTNPITVGGATINGNLNVTGTTTTVTITDLNVIDRNITVNYSTGDSSSTVDGAGLIIQDAVNSTTDASMLWDATAVAFDFSHEIQAPTGYFVDSVGIGTDTPSASLEIDTATSDIKLTSTANTGELHLFQGYNSYIDSNRSLYVSTGTTGEFVFTSSGRLGVGTESPAVTLSVKSDLATPVDIESTTANTWLRFNNANSTAPGYIGYEDGDDMTFWTTGTERARIDSSGSLLVNSQSAGALTSPSTGRGLIDVDGTSDSAIELKAGGSTYGYLYTSSSEFRVANLTANPLTFFTNNTEAARIDSAGNLGLGTFTPSNYGGGFVVDDLGINIVDASSSAPGTNKLSWWSDNNGNSQNAYISTVNDGSTTNTGEMVFYTKDVNTSLAERVRINSNGNFLVGTQTWGSIGTRGCQLGAGGTGIFSNTADVPIYLNRDNGDTSSQPLMSFFRNQTQSGTINASQGGTPAFGAPSDIRLKDNVTDHESELANVMALRPVRWDWKDEARGSGEGFIAQELEQTAWSDLVSEFDDYKVVSGLGTVETRLIKALQEAVTRIETLEAEVAALKGE